MLFFLEFVCLLIQYLSELDLSLLTNKPHYYFMKVDTAFFKSYELNEVHEDFLSWVIFVHVTRGLPSNILRICFLIDETLISLYLNLGSRP